MFFDARFTLLLYFLLLIMCCQRTSYRIFIKLGKNCMLKILIALSGGDNRDRTGNLQLAKLALSQLSYIPKFKNKT